MNEEIWKDIVGYEGYYEVSNKGNVRSVDRWITYLRLGRPTKRLWKAQNLKLKLNDYGYFSVHLRNSSEDKEEWPTVHLLVAKAFLPNLENKATVNHIDGIKTNNSVENLEWSTHKEQVDHAISSGLMKLRGKTIYSEEFKQEVKDYFDNNSISIKKLGKLFGISERTAGRISKGQWGDERKVPKVVVAEMRNLRLQGFTLHEIGEKVGYNFSTVHNWAKDIKIDREHTDRSG